MKRLANLLSALLLASPAGACNKERADVTAEQAPQPGDSEGRFLGSLFGYSTPREECDGNTLFLVRRVSDKYQVAACATFNTGNVLGWEILSPAGYQFTIAPRVDQEGNAQMVRATYGGDKLPLADLTGIIAQGYPQEIHQTGRMSGYYPGYSHMCPAGQQLYVFEFANLPEALVCGIGHLPSFIASVHVEASATCQRDFMGRPVYAATRPFTHSAQRN